MRPSPLGPGATAATVGAAWLSANLARRGDMEHESRVSCPETETCGEMNGVCWTAQRPGVGWTAGPTRTVARLGLLLHKFDVDPRTYPRRRAAESWPGTDDAHRRGRCALYDNLPLQPAPKDGLRMRLNETLLGVRQGSSPPPVLSHHPVLYSTHSSLFFYSLCLFTLFLPPLAIHHRHPASSADSRESQQTGTLHRQSLLLSTRGRVASAQRARDVDTGTSKTRIARERERERE